MGKKGAQQGGEPRFLTEEEIWDDSALLQTWDDAVQEYERYHSIHARGEDIEEVLKRAEEGDLKAGYGNDHEAADASASVEPDKQGEDEVMAGAEEPVESHDPVAAKVLNIPCTQDYSPGTNRLLRNSNLALSRDKRKMTSRSHCLQTAWRNLCLSKSPQVWMKA
ncbi:hypothetical protein KEM55_005663 [Ascosphaera atra]|nr:hypothetical protein KEM55_005663 [Ascosphaera atra]